MPTAEEIEAQKAARHQVRKSPAFQLRNMRVQEVGLVPFGANARVFPIVKADGEHMKIKMSGQAQKTALGALQELAEKIASTAAIASGAELDDTAPAPAELGKLFKALGDTAIGLAKQYGAGDEAADDEKKKAEKAVLEEAQKAGKGFPGAAPPFGKKKPGEDDGEEAQKAIEFTVEHVSKAGKKMAKSRLDAVKTAHATLGKIIAEVDDAEADSSASGVALGKKLDGIVAKMDALDAKMSAKSGEELITKSAVEDMLVKSNAALVASITAGKGAPTALADSNATNAGRSEPRPKSLLPFDLRDVVKDEFAHLDPKGARR